MGAPGGKRDGDGVEGPAGRMAEDGLMGCSSPSLADSSWTEGAREGPGGSMLLRDSTPNPMDGAGHASGLTPVGRGVGGEHGDDVGG